MRLVQTTDPKPVELLIAKFAAKHNLKAQKDTGDDTKVIFGRSGQIYHTPINVCRHLLRLQRHFGS
jgi:hypothetical protein